MQLAGGSYPLTASFRSAEGISVGTDVRLAGITVGSVTGLELDPRDLSRRRRPSRVAGDLALPEDSDVKIASESLLGGSFVEITPGASEFMLAAGRRDREHPRVGQPAQPPHAFRDRHNDPVSPLVAALALAAGQAVAAQSVQSVDTPGDAARRASCTCAGSTR